MRSQAAQETLPFSGRQADRVDEICDAFEAAWNAGGYPDIHRFLQQAGADPERLLVKLIAVDLHYRWKHAAQSAYSAAPSDDETIQLESGDSNHDPWLVETYYRKFAPTADDDAIPLHLICEEFRARCRAGLRPLIVEYRRRFPRRAAKLSEALQKADAEESGGGTSDRTDAVTASTSLTRLRLVAKGGLGQVSLAQDHTLNRKLALKEILPKFADIAECRSRFLAEAVITGRLEHPGVVPVYTLGETEQGRPFYAMRYIRGETLARVVENLHRRRKSGAGDLLKFAPELRRLLRTFIDICNTLEYAHRRGVIHRDLKPSNIMLGKYGETLVIDWGLAKLYHEQTPQNLVEESRVSIVSPTGSTQTRDGSTVGTPAYMSPEQASGNVNSLGPASDIYSLGATLYHMLTGQPPFSTRSDILSAVARGDFPNPRSLVSEIPRPLEAICLRAMAREESQRYASARALGEDVERWLGDEPVTAYQETRLERLRRWARRHRSWVLAAQVALLAVAVIASVSTAIVLRAWSRESEALSRERDARSHAEESKEEAITRFAQARDATDKWLTGGAAALRYFEAGQTIRQAMLQEAVADYEQLAQSAFSDAELEIERGRTWLRIGGLYIELLDAEQAKVAFDRADDIFRSVLKQNPEHQLAALELANCEANRAVLDMERGEVTAAEQKFETAISQLAALQEIEDAADYQRVSLASARANYGEMLVEVGRIADAVPQLTAAGELSRAVRSADFLDEARLTESRATQVLGRAELARAAYESAAAVLQRASLVAEILVEQQPANPDFRHQHALSCQYLGSAHRLAGRQTNAEQCYRDALADYEQVILLYPTVASFQESAALTHIDLAVIQHEAGKTAAAVQHAEKAHELLASVVNRDPSRFSSLDHFALCRDVQGHLHHSRGELDAALEALQQATGIYDNLIAALDESGSDVPSKILASAAASHSHLAQVLHDQQDYAASEKAFQRALIIAARRAAKEPTLFDMQAQVCVRLGMAFQQRERLEQARRAYVRALSLWQELARDENMLPEHRFRYCQLLVNCPLADMHDLAAAKTQVAALLEAAPQNADYNLVAAAAAFRSGDGPAAKQLVDAAVLARGETHGSDLLWRALLASQDSDAKRAREHLEQARAWINQSMPGQWDLRMLRAEVEQHLASDD